MPGARPPSPAAGGWEHPEHPEQDTLGGCCFPAPAERSSSPVGRAERRSVPPSSYPQPKRGERTGTAPKPPAAGCPAGPARQSASRAAESSFQPPAPARSPPALQSPTGTAANEARASKRRTFPSCAAPGKPHGAAGWLPPAIEHQAWPKLNAPALLPASAPISHEVLPPAGTTEPNGRNPSRTRTCRCDVCPR